jgi:hypothetical protein
MYYFWMVRAPGHPFQWGYDLGGYYNYLARGFLRGHLYTALDPDPKLLALPDPYAENVGDSLKVWDMALYRGHYYLYHGVAPAVLLFTPWRIVTGHDVPENFGVALFCLAGFLLSGATLFRVLPLAGAELPAPLLALVLLALAFCQGVPLLLSRVWVYEVAIACGYCCLSGGVFFLTGALGSLRPAAWLAASGLMFGLSIACRPHFGLAAIIATGALAAWGWRKRRLRLILPFLVPLTAAGLALAAYNYARFGNPFEFGVRYLMGIRELSRTELRARWVVPGLYYLLVCQPAAGPEYPWLYPSFRRPFDVPGFYLEPTVGCLYMAPFLIGTVFIGWARGARMILAVALASAVAILLFVAGTGFMTQRYEVDFLPLATLAAAAGFAVAIARFRGWPRYALIAGLAGSSSAGIACSLALAMSGPYNNFLHDRPESFARIARRFGPIARYRPLLDPPVDLDITAVCAPHYDGFREPLVAMGRSMYREVVALEHHPEKFRIIANSETNSAVQEIDSLGVRPHTFHIVYRPETHVLTVAVDGTPVVTQSLEHLYTAPSQVTPGKNRYAGEVSPPDFEGKLLRVTGGIK